MPHVYILRCSDGSYYVGRTDDLPSRLKAHDHGRAASWTARRRPAELVYSEECDDVTAALRRETQIKHWTRAKKEALINGDLGELKNLSKRRQS